MRLGRPGWRLWARAGKPIYVVIDVIRDDEAGVYVATSPDVRGLVLEAVTLDELKTEVEEMLPEILEANYPIIRRRPLFDLRFTPNGNELKMA